MTSHTVADFFGHQLFALLFSEHPAAHLLFCFEDRWPERSKIWPYKPLNEQTVGGFVTQLNVTWSYSNTQMEGDSKLGRGKKEKRDATIALGYHLQRRFSTRCPTLGLNN